MPNIGTREDLSVLRFRKGGSTRYFTSGLLATALTTLVSPAAQIYVMPYYCAVDERYDRIAIDQIDPLAGNYTRLGVYADDGNIAPGRLILDAGTVEINPAGVREISINLHLSGKQLYWLAFVPSTDYNCRGIAVASLHKIILGIDSGLGTAWGSFIYKTVSYVNPPDPLPNPFGTPSGIGTTLPPAVFLRKV